MKIRNLKLWMGIATLFLLVSTGPLAVYAQEVELPPEQFSVYLLTPNTNANRIAWSTLIQGELPKAGIGITDNVFVGFDIVGARSFSYDAGVDGIPTHRDAGFDLAFVGLSGALDYDPTGSYSNSTLSPTGLNFAWFQNTTADDLIQDYASETDATARDAIAEDIQAILYEEQPYIPIINTQGLWSHQAALGLTEEQILLLSVTGMSMGWADIDHPDTDEVVYAHSYQLTQFHPFVANEYIANAYLTPILPGLFERTAADPTVWGPALAASMPTAVNATAYDVDINPAAEFSNGNPVTAADVVNTYHMHMNADIASVAQGNILPYISNESRIVAVDSDTVRFNFDAPYFGALGVMSAGIMEMATIGTPTSPAATDFNDDDATYLMGAGPYEWSAFDADSNTVEITAVADWWGGAIATPTVTFEQNSAQSATDNIQLAGDAADAVHIIDSQITYDPAVLEDAAGVTVSVIADFGTQFLTVNMRHPILGTGVETPLGIADASQADDAARYIRKAISHLIPRDTIVEQIAQGRATAATSLWPDVAGGYDDSLQPYEYNVELAIEYMEMAGYTFPDAEVDEDPTPFGIIPVALAALFSSFVMMRRRRD